MPRSPHPVPPQPARHQQPTSCAVEFVPAPYNPGLRTHNAVMRTAQGFDLEGYLLGPATDKPGAIRLRISDNRISHSTSADHWHLVTLKLTPQEAHAIARQLQELASAHHMAEFRARHPQHPQD